jgi:hypothetical protein
MGVLSPHLLPPPPTHLSHGPFPPPPSPSPPCPPPAPPPPPPSVFPPFSPPRPPPPPPPSPCDPGADRAKEKPRSGHSNNCSQHQVSGPGTRSPPADTFTHRSGRAAQHETAPLAMRWASPPSFSFSPPPPLPPHNPPQDAWPDFFHRAGVGLPECTPVRPACGSSRQAGASPWPNFAAAERRIHDRASKLIGAGRARRRESSNGHSRAQAASRTKPILIARDPVVVGDGGPARLAPGRSHRGARHAVIHTSRGETKMLRSARHTARLCGGQRVRVGAHRPAHRSHHRLAPRPPPPPPTPPHVRPTRVLLEMSILGRAAPVARRGRNAPGEVAEAATSRSCGPRLPIPAPGRRTSTVSRSRGRARTRPERPAQGGEGSRRGLTLEHGESTRTKDNLDVARSR